MGSDAKNITELANSVMFVAEVVGEGFSRERRVRDRAERTSVRHRELGWHGATLRGRVRPARVPTTLVS